MSAETLWDLAAAREARDEALERVHDAPWASFAWPALEAVARRQAVVTSDDLWKELDRRGIPRPIEGRAAGPVMLRGVREGLIQPLGFTTGTNRKHHGDVMRTYQSRLHPLRAGR